MAWYGTAKKGGEVARVTLMCMLCHTLPKYTHLQHLGLPIRNVRRPNMEDWKDSMIYAWCTSCDTIKPAIPKECGGEPVHATLSDWMCDSCHAAPRLAEVE